MSKDHQGRKENNRTTRKMRNEKKKKALRNENRIEK
jgi:hypothetical protein